MIAVGRDWLADEAPSLEEPKANAGAESMYCRLILTSGATGEPKAVALTYAQAFTRVMRQQFVYGGRFAESSRIFVDVGISTVAGFSTLFNIFWRGGGLFLQNNDPVETLTAIFANRTTRSCAGTQSSISLTLSPIAWRTTSNSAAGRRLG
jgi:acyl-CoA synthetase (AMP-forming)/AMP-acid ligase II